VEHLVQLATSFIDHAGYGALFVLMAAGNVGIPVGTEVVMPIAGAFAAKGHLSSVWLVGLVGTLGEVLGAGILYTIGFYGGRPFVARWGRFVGLSLHKLDIAHGFYERYGKKMVFFCRFIPIIRGISSLPAGISQMQKRYFFTFTAAGSWPRPSSGTGSRIFLPCAAGTSRPSTTAASTRRSGWWTCATSRPPATRPTATPA